MKLKSLLKKAVKNRALLIAAATLVAPSAVAKVRAKVAKVRRKVD